MKKSAQGEVYEEEEEDGSEINWLDDDNGGGDDDYAENNDEYGFDLRSTGSAPLLHQQQKQQRRPSAGSGNQKGIKLNSNYHEDAEIGALHRRAGVEEETRRHPQQQQLVGKNNVCDWTKVRNNNCKRAGRMGIANEEISDGNQNHGDASTIARDEVSSSSAGAEEGMGLSGVAESRYSGSNSNNNKSNNNDTANNSGGKRILAGESVTERGAAADIVDELETVVLRLAATEGAESRGNSTLATTCVT